MSYQVTETITINLEQLQQIVAEKLGFGKPTFKIDGENLAGALTAVIERQKNIEPPTYERLNGKTVRATRKSSNNNGISLRDLILASLKDGNPWQSIKELYLYISKHYGGLFQENSLYQILSALHKEGLVVKDKEGTLIKYAMPHRAGVSALQHHFFLNL